MICFLDMDGVLCDFMTGAMAAHDETYDESEWPVGVWDVEKVLDCSAEEFWRAIDAQGVWFWSDLCPFDWTATLLRRLRGRFDEVVITTSPSKSPHSYAGKKHWLDKYLVSKIHPLIFTNRKELLAGPDRLLIDDGDHNVKRFRDAGGSAVSFPQPWSESWSKYNDEVHHDGRNRVEFVMEQVAIVEGSTQ